MRSQVPWCHHYGATRHLPAAETCMEVFALEQYTQLCHLSVWAKRRSCFERQAGVEDAFENATHR